MKRIFFKSLALSIAIWQSVFVCVFPALAIAEESSPIAEVEVTVVTGDADSSSTSQTDANTTQTQVEGDLGGSTCSGSTTDCPGQAEVDTQQEAVADTGSTSGATSGENEVDTSESQTQVDVTITTGDSTSTATEDSEVNTNIVELVPPETGTPAPSSPPSPAPIESIQPSTTPTPTDTATLDVNTDQVATTSAETSSSASTGENVAISEATSEIISGSAVAVANALNISNINLVGSDLAWVIETILNDQEKDINFYDLFMSLSTTADSDIPQDATIVTDQKATIQNENSADASTGSNTAQGETASVNSGDSVAIANSVNLANLNLVGSKGVLGIVNIVGSLVGDIILPNQNHLIPVAFPWYNTEVITKQDGEINSSSSSVSNSGTNNLEGNGSINTGNASSYSNAVTYLNLTRVADTWVLLFINNFGNWGGKLVNWTNPGESVELEKGSQVLEKENEVTPQEPPQAPQGGSLKVLTNQSVDIDSTTSASSDTGNNKLVGTGDIKSGDAFSLANDFSLANFVGVGGSFVFGVLNILGKWSGNLIVAYPDLEVSVSDGLDTNFPGSAENYMISVTNRGKAVAAGVVLDFLPDSKLIVSDNSHWDLGGINPGESRTVKVTGVIDQNAPLGSTLTSSVQVASQETEESTSNNQSSDSTAIVANQTNVVTSSSADTRTPNLNVSIWNNVGEYVYPGDTVIARIVVVNNSPFLARGVTVEGSLSNDHPMPALPMMWEIGDIRSGEQVGIEFSIALIDDLPAGTYHLKALAIGHAESGDESSSGLASSNFLVKILGLARYAAAPVEATYSEVPESQDVLGISSQGLPFDKNKYWPYIFVALLASLYPISIAKKRLKNAESENH